jgi:hypothetical protein
MDYFINIANILYLISYFERDMLRLRLFTIVGAFLLILYFALRPEPIMPVIYWNVVFIGPNIHRMKRIVHNRRALAAGIALRASLQPSDDQLAARPMSSRRVFITSCP